MKTLVSCYVRKYDTILLHLTLLTIITATLNAESNGRGESLLRCVRSVAALPFAHEHVIVDGGSTDGSLTQLTASDVVVISEPDHGIYDALNKGLAVAKGKWILVLGDDDELLDSAALSAAIAQGERLGAELVASPVLTDDGKTIAVRFWNVLGGMAYPHQGLLVRTDVMRRAGGFNARFRIAGDYDLCLRLHLSCAKFVIAPSCFCRFSTHGCSTDCTTAAIEVADIIATRLDLSDVEHAFVRTHRVLPLVRSLRLLVHRDRVIRRAAVHQIVKRLSQLLSLCD